MEFIVHECNNQLEPEVSNWLLCECTSYVHPMPPEGGVVKVPGSYVISSNRIVIALLFDYYRLVEGTQLQ